jgi:hypothetical protein
MSLLRNIVRAISARRAKSSSDFMNILIEFGYRDIEIFMRKKQVTKEKFEYSNIIKATKDGERDLVLKESYGVIMHIYPNDQFENALRLMLTAEQRADFIGRKLKDYGERGFSIKIKSTFPNYLFARSREQLAELTEKAELTAFKPIEKTR